MSHKVKVIYLLSFVVTLSLIISSVVFAKIPTNKVLNQTKSATIDNTTYIDANKILMFVTNHGNFGRDLSGVFGYDYGTWYPYTGNLDDILNNIQNLGSSSPLYAAGLWIGGKVNNDIRIAISEYSSEYVPGPMENGTFMYDRSEFRVYKLYTDSLQSNPNSDYLNWPADQGAPVDEFGRPLMRGDQMLWSVFNDADPNGHYNMSTAPLGIEIQQTVWAQDEEGTDTIPTLGQNQIVVHQFGNSVVYVNIEILDATLFSGDDYIIISENDTTLGLLWHLYNISTGQTVLENQTDFSGTGIAIDGMLIKVYYSPSLYFEWEWEGAYREIGGVNWGGSGFFGGIGLLDEFFVSDLTPMDIRTVEIRWVADGTGQNAYLYDRSNGYSYEAYAPQNFTVWDVTPGGPERQINFSFVENNWDLPHFQRDQLWNPGEQQTDINYPYPATPWDSDGGREYFQIMSSDYSGGTPNSNYNVDGWFSGSDGGTNHDVLFGGWLNNRGNYSPTGKPSPGDIFRFTPNYITNPFDTFSFNTIPYTPLTTGDDGVSIYMMYKLFNKGGNQIDSCYISLWADPDLGIAGDDYVGCDTLSDIGYCYNENNIDNNYGTVAPAIGFKFIHGPLVSASGEEAMFDDAIIPDFKNLKMSSFNKYVNGTDPDNAQQVYWYMKGLDAGNNGVPYVYNNDTLTYMVSGDPVVGTGDLDFDASDRRFMATVGPFDFAPGDSQYVLIKMAVGHGSDYLNSITKMKDILSSPIDNSCCIGFRGNIDYDGNDQIDISDLVYLVDYMWTGGPAPSCLEEANVDSSVDNIIDISDLVYLVDYMWTGGPQPAVCP